MKEVMSKKNKALGVSKPPLDLENSDKGYLDEKELFLLFSLLKRKHISTMWSNVFTPTINGHIHIPDDTENKVDFFEKEASKNLEKIKSRTQSSIVLSYLLRLGKQIDEKGFSVYCNADYSLIEGGFLSEYIGDIMHEYLADTDEGRKSEKYKRLSKEQRDFLDQAIKDKDFDKDISKRVELTKLEHPPVEAYREAILNKKADGDFIELANKLITEYDGSRWDTEDTERFLEIYYRHNKEEFKKNMISEKTFLYEDYQTKLAGLIFENTDKHLSIKNANELENYLSQYIKRFMADELDGRNGYGLTQNFFSEGLTIPLYTKMFGFKKQKDILIKHIEGKYNEYQRNDLEVGHPYIEPQYIGNDRPESVKITISETNKDKDLFLFVHTMFALEYEKYLEIESFSYGTTGIFDLYDRGFIFKIRLSGKKGVSGQMLFEGFDEKHNLLKFAGQGIELSKKNKETDAVLLIKTLKKEPERYWFNDELLGDWGYQPHDETTKNKAYFAARKINEAVKMKTGVDDFIDHNTSKFRINPKYLKIDE